MMRRFILFVASCIASVALLGCNEDKSHTSLGATPATTSAQSRTDLLFGWYGSYDHTVLETQDHANLQFVTAWGTTGGYFQVKGRLLEARAAGTKCVILDVPMSQIEFQAEERTREFFEQLRQDGLIDSRICALYPGDEVDLNGRGEKAVLASNALVRRLAYEYGFAANIPLAVIYTSRKAWTAIADYDWVGFDDYGQGSAVLSNDVWQDMKAKLRPEQRIILVPGAFQCANVWDFYAKAQADKQVIALIAFIWFDGWDGPDSKGARSMDCRIDYINAATRIKNAT